jgi:hypothetical protein
MHSFPWSYIGLERLAQSGEALNLAQGGDNPSAKGGGFGLALRGTLLYALEGWAAPPGVLVGCLVLLCKCFMLLYTSFDALMKALYTALVP